MTDLGFGGSLSWRSSPRSRWWPCRGAAGRCCAGWGLNPWTVDTDRKPRPTLRKVVAWAKEWQLDGVLVVNLFA
jgi:hypothetical protein